MTSRQKRARRTLQRRLKCEVLEGRQMLASFVPSPIGDGLAGSLREAIAIANTNKEADEIRLTAGVYRLDLATEGDLDVSENGKTTKIIGAGRGHTVIDATSLGDRAFDVWKDAVLELEGVTIVAGEIDGDGAGIRNAGALTLHDVEITGGTANGDGGAVFNSGTALLQAVWLVGNAAERGGGLANDSNGIVTGNEVVVASNIAFWPPEYTQNFNFAFGVGGGVMNLGHMELSQVKFISNQSDNFGGGVENHGHLTITDALLAENNAPVGSAVYSFRAFPSLGGAPAETVLADVILSNNISAWNRDAVESRYATLKTTNVTEGDQETGILAHDASFTVLEDSSDNVLQLASLGWNTPASSALTRAGATSAVVEGNLRFSPEPNHSGLDVVVLVDGSGLPHLIDVWVEPQNDPFTIEFPQSFQSYTWEQAYLDPPFEYVAKGPYEIGLPVLESVSHAPDIGERLTITAVSASHGGAVAIWDPNAETERDPAEWPDNSSWIVYSPLAGFSGVETITYTVTDGNGCVLEGAVEAHVEDREDVMQFRLEARNSAGEIVDHVRRGEMIDVYVCVASGLDETVIRSATAEIQYHPSQVERVSDVEFGDALPDLQWWGDTKSKEVSDRRTLGMRADAGFNVFDDPHDEVVLAQFSMRVVGNGIVELAFDAKDCTGNLYDVWPATSIPFAAIDFVDLSLMVVEGWHNPQMPADVDGDSVVVPRDALILINALNQGGSRRLSDSGEGEGAPGNWMYYDVNDDGYLSPADVLYVINVLNSSSASGEGEAGAVSSEVAVSTLDRLVEFPTASRTGIVSSLVADGTTGNRENTDAERRVPDFVPLVSVVDDRLLESLARDVARIHTAAVDRADTTDHAEPDLLSLDELSDTSL